MVPQLRRGENSLYLWNHGNCLQPVHQFVGHQDVILELEWRKQKEGKKKSYTVISHFILLNIRMLFWNLNGENKKKVKLEKNLYCDWSFYF